MCPCRGSRRFKPGRRSSVMWSRVTPATKLAGAKVSLRFDSLAVGKRRIPLVTNLRALATMMDVSEAQVPESGPDRGTSEYSWTTHQIGGEIAYHGRGAIVNGSHAVGYSEAGGALVQVSSRPRRQVPRRSRRQRPAPSLVGVLFRCLRPLRFSQPDPNPRRTDESSRRDNAQIEPG
jgi:hypothetical protein